MKPPRIRKTLKEEKVAQMKHSHQGSRNKGAVEWMCCWSLHLVSEEGKKTAVLESAGGQDKKDKMVDSLETDLGSHNTSFYDLGSRSANFYDLHRVNQVIQHKIIIRKIRRQAQERMEKEEECLLRLKKKKLIERHIQFTLTHKASHPFYRVGIPKKP